MALPHQKQSLQFLNKPLGLVALLALMTLQSCKHEKKIFKSECDIDKDFKTINFKQLMDSLDDYDQQYIEISGKYEEDKGISALVSDSLFTDSSTGNALWVDFSQDCPLYLAGTHQGLFEYNDGQFTRINNKEVTLRGVIVLRNKGKNDQYKATIERVSLVKL
ncbi:hypothetical protein [Mucilaginibacter sp. BT774]|uniref:hypothetical protein n=1 Tax=Mucilaginibacter sp. BT774 TaxID=3062276 RepID=UPI0026754748|nr:hypothetical protein [Mucilaginibacter sp. BT774]MDO3627881.1 hypothetical protein [Mucilaginibacter sp. BT774]